MTEHRWAKWWWQDWQRDPALRMCSPAARGCWMDMLCIMADAEPYGHLLVNNRSPSDRQLASVFGVPEKEAKAALKEMEDCGVFSRTAEGIIFNRRMVRDKAVSDRAVADGKRGGNPSLKAAKTPKVNGGGNPGGLTPSHNEGGYSLEAEADSEAEAERTPKAPSRREAAADAAGDNFDAFWNAYPRKVGKDAARKAFAAALKRASLVAIATGLNRQKWPSDPQFIPHPATWLNGGRWADDPNAAAPPGQPKLTGMQARMAASDAVMRDWIDEIEQQTAPASGPLVLQ